MFDTLPPKPTREERARYWRDVREEAWGLSRDQFQLHHGIIVAAIALLLRGYILGWGEMMNELFTSLLYVATPVALYLVGLYIINFIRAMVRVPIHHQREIAKLGAQLDKDTVRRKQRETLARFLARGEELLATYKSPKDVADTLWLQWVGEVSTYLDTAFDHSYVIRWGNYAGLVTYSGGRSDIPQSNQKISRDISFRLIRLQEFLKELT